MRLYEENISRGFSLIYLNSLQVGLDRGGEFFGLSQGMGRLGIEWDQVPVSVASGEPR